MNYDGYCFRWNRNGVFYVDSCRLKKKEVWDFMCQSESLINLPYYLARKKLREIGSVVKIKISVIEEDEREK